MTVAQLARTLKKSGAKLELDETGRLKIVARHGVLTPELKTQIIRLREPLTALVRRIPAPAPRFKYGDDALDFGEIAIGFTPASWIVELRRKAKCCSAIKPDIEARYLAWAQDIEDRLDGTEP